MARCLANTRSGAPCKNPAKTNGDGHCAVHGRVCAPVSADIIELVKQLVTRFRALHPTLGWVQLVSCVAQAWKDTTPKATKPLTRYQLYVQANMPEIARMYPKMPPKERMRLIAKMWQELHQVPTVPVPVVPVVPVPVRLSRKRSTQV
jgi:hypothetical protein